MASSKRSAKKSAAQRQAPSQASRKAEPNFRSLVKSLVRAVKRRKYDEVESIGNMMLESSPSEEADRCIHDIIRSATTIRDAEDEIFYQLEDLKAAIDLEIGGPDVDGL